MITINFDLISLDEEGQSFYSWKADDGTTGQNRASGERELRSKIVDHAGRGIILFIKY